IAQWFSVGMTAAYAIGTVFGSPFVERYGRRPMLLFFSTANVIVLSFYVIFAAMESHISFIKYGCLLCFVIYGFNYGFGVGSIAWFLSSELVPQRHRSLMQSMTSAINTVILIILTFTILPLFSLIKAYVFLVLYIIPSSFGIFILYAYLPETKGREIYQIVAELKGKKSQRIMNADDHVETEESDIN
uniref:Major facilitator superfamily (MFS) profile domain-containing protein n=1 Tax=Panagrolaimus sp. ES5 TaxID=591445 RepID=A0AC34FDS9_9BILA